MRIRRLTCLGSMLLAYGSAHGATLVVPDQFPTIQSAISSASNGDTVLVRSNTYVESLSWGNKNLVILGDGAASSVVITTNATSRVAAIGPGVTSHTVLRNLTFRGGFAEEGAGMKLIDASPLLQRCRFESNVAVQDVEFEFSRGGAMFVDAGSRPVVEDCFFGSNRAEPPFPQVDPPGLGGAIFVEAEATLEIRRCLFEENVAWGFEGGAGGGLFVASSGSALIDICTFLGNTGYGGGVYSRGEVIVRYSEFNANLGWTGPAIYSEYGSYVIENSIFHDNEVVGNEGGTIVTIGPGEITSNTVAFNIGTFDYAGIYGPVATMSRNIASHNQGWGITQCESQAFSCNDVWGNEINGAPANYECGDMTGINDNFSSDPLFCDSASDDYRLQPGSPCAPTNSPPGCGLIGALSVGCGVAGITDEPVSSTSVSLVVRPNPVSRVGEFLLNRNVRSAALEIYDSTGRLIDVIGPIASRMRWEVPSRTASGVYFARLSGDGVNKVVKFVVVR